MYFRILKRDLKRKKTMNIILLLFIILAAAFVAGSMNNMVSVMTALESFFDKAGVPDYWICIKEEQEADRFQEFAGEYHYDAECQKFIQADPAEVRVNGGKFHYSNTICLSTLGKKIKIFDKNDKEITEVKKGELYLTGQLWNSVKNEFRKGDQIEVSLGGKKRSFKLAGSTKDAMFGSAMIGMSRFLLNEEDYRYFESEDTAVVYSMNVYTKDTSFGSRFNSLELNAIFNEDRDTIKKMYFMDMVMAGVMLIVSVCLILISMVILRFTIQFTMSEEFREIGVMKAVGIRNRRIRGLYIIKYLGISSVGGIAGLILSVPFGRLMLGNFQQNIVMPDGGFFWINVVCAFGAAAVVVLFCYFCTRRIRKISPIDAIRNGENGERYSKKGIVHLNSAGIPPVLFMAVNDILSNIRRFSSLILIFTLGLLLVVIPVNTINTVQSDKLISWFNMVPCDHVVSKEQLFNSNSNNRAMVEEYLSDVKEKLKNRDISADVYEEVMFRMNISYRGKKTSSIAFQGLGDITTDQYVYLEGDAPRKADEVAVSHIIAERIGADIGDTVEIKDADRTKHYIVTAIYQSMNNMGEGIRFHPEEEINYAYAGGSFGAQIKYHDSPDSGELEGRMEILKELFPDSKIYTSGGYVNYMIGDVAGQLQGLKRLVLAVVLCINVLVTVLMVKSFLTKEKGEIALLKAIGFQNSALSAWQTLRIGIVQLISVLLGVLAQGPLSEISSGQAFKVMGAYNIEFDVVPFEVYVLYPGIVFGVTVLAAFLASLQIRKIKTSETANIE